ncbi:MAG: hypothetical protein ACLQDC_05715 [Verrucomicrobiia bacterium]
MSQFAELLKAIAALLWPLLGFTAVFLFRAQLRDVIGRLKKGKFFGQEVELEASLRKLDMSATAAASEVSKLPQTKGDEGEAVQGSTEDGEIIDLAARSPKAALVALSATLEKEARDVLAVSGHLKGRSHVPFREAIAEIESKKLLLPHVSGSLKQFWEVRNRIVHGHGATDDDVLRAIDSGMSILRALRAVPRQTFTVLHPGVPVYSDADGKTLIASAKGVILEGTGPGGVEKTRMIFPTTRDHFRKGQKVAWEWSFERQWGTAWYRDPETSELKQAWGSAVEFTGRPLDTL